MADSIFTSGRLLVWDATCPDTFATSYLPSAASDVGEVAAAAEERKRRKYSHLDQGYSFVPVAIETAGVFGPETMDFMRELGSRLQLASADRNSFTYLIQRLSVAVQRRNAASVLGNARSLQYKDFLRPLDFCCIYNIMYEEIISIIIINIIYCYICIL